MGENASEFEGLAAVVTGGASGIGLATVELLRARGATVVAVDRAGGDVTCDVTDDAGVVAAIEQVVADHGRIDILVNNAGIGAIGSIEETPLDEWQRVFDVNVYGAVRMTRAALPHLRRSPAAAVVNTGSVAGETGLVKRAAYSASKGAVEALTRAMAADLLPDKVRVNAVAPGTADTPWVGRLLDQAEDPVAARAALVARQPIGRLITADESCSRSTGDCAPCADAPILTPPRPATCPNAGVACPNAGVIRGIGLPCRGSGSDATGRILHLGGLVLHLGSTCGQPSAGVWRAGCEVHEPRA
jgi:NAD(P)-dependent dehydrogenase (short-subunit alcohol dehydrogenase family)